MDASFCDANYLLTTANNLCDAPIYSYCKTTAGKYDQLCACINSAIPNPDCHDEKCRASGAFMPKNMVRQPCPTVIDCRQIVNMTGEMQSSLVNVAQYQFCGVDSGGNAVNKDITPPPAPTMAPAAATNPTAPAAPEVSTGMQMPANFPADTKVNTATGTNKAGTSSTVGQLGITVPTAPPAPIAPTPPPMPVSTPVAPSKSTTPQGANLPANIGAQTPTPTPTQTQTQTTAEKSSNQNTTIIAIVAVLIVLALIGGGVAYKINSKPKVKKIKPAEPITPAPSDTSTGGNPYSPNFHPNSLG